MIATYVLDTGALIAAERGKQRAARFIRLASIGAARLVIPLAVVAEWWRGRSDARDEILATARVHASLTTAKAAGVALARARHVDATQTIDAEVMATAAVLDGIVVTSDVEDLLRFAPQFPGVTVLSV